jgi:hypothetical protein
VYGYSEILVEKGDQIRLQDIKMSYDFKPGLAKKMHLQFIQMYVYANNIGLLWTANKLGIDPDYVSGVPNPRSVAVGIRADF